jgi:hypothetical protein
MKSFKLALLALVAALALSAFTSVKKSQPHTVADPYYWYHVDGTQTQTSGSTVNPSALELKTVFVEGDCMDDEDTDICLVGFSEEVQSGTPIPSDPARIIRETENP